MLSKRIRRGLDQAVIEGLRDVVVVGSGPTGMILAAELKIAGTDVVILERRTSEALLESRAGGLHAGTLELLEQRGIADRFISAGQKAQVASFGFIPLDISDFPIKHNYGLGLWQRNVERILVDWLEKLQVPIYRGADVTSFEDVKDRIHIQLRDSRSVSARYLIGCDGGRSLVRKLAGIAFPGSAPTISHLIAEVEFGEEPAWGLRHDVHGIHSISRLEDGPTARIMTTEPSVGSITDPTLSDLSKALTAAYGSDYKVHSPVWITRFTDTSRQAATYRKGRVILAGDAAHIHYPAGGQGINLGMQDAVNLGWKLAQVVKGQSPPDLLNTYQTERHPVATRILRNTMAQVALLRTDDQTAALREMFSALLTMTEPRQHLAAMVSGLDTRYDLGNEHPLIGRRMPNITVSMESGPTTFYSLLRDARPVLLNLTGRSLENLSGWQDRIKQVDAEFNGEWLLPVIGNIPVSEVVLIRPDGYVAWVGNTDQNGLIDALTYWFGTSTETKFSPTDGADG